jgi:phosphoribosylformylglycinamidine synthase
VLLDGLAAGGASPAPTTEFAREFSSSEYSKTVAHIVAGEPPGINLAAERRLIDCLVALASEGTVQSAHDISAGGLAVTIAESCFAATPSAVGARHAVPVLGASVNLDDATPAEHVLFNERGARAILSVTPTNLAAVFATARQYGVGAREIGKVHLAPSLRIEYKGHAVIDSPHEPLRDVWANSLERNLKVRT